MVSMGYIVNSDAIKLYLMLVEGAVEGL